MASPTVEIRRVRMVVGRVGATMEVENEFIGREEQVADGAFNALRTRAVVTYRNEAACESGGGAYIGKGRGFSEIYVILGYIISLLQ